MKDSIQEIIDQFIEQKGMEYQAEGMPRIAGRLIGLMLVEDGPFSFPGLAVRLKVSRGSISTNTRLLENLGLVDRVSKPGERGDFFQLSQNPFSSLLEGINLRIKRSLKNTSHARDHLPKRLKSTQARLAKLESFYQGFLANNEQLIETLHD
jgi:DNA-binding transcriptional regulator GbsR (MarR family)